MTTEEIVKTKLKSLIDEVGKTVFVKDYEPSDEEVVGIIVAKYFDWAGDNIAKVAYNAFEDANFHKFNKRFMTLLQEFGMGVPA